MKIYDKKKIGKRVYSIVGEGANLFECGYELSKLSFGDVDKCGVCGSDNLILNARISGVKKHKYVEIKCLSCKGAVVFGKMQENPDVFYLRKNDKKQPDWKSYNAQKTDEELENMIK